MNSLFTAEFFVGNRRRLRAAVAADVVLVVTANGLLQRTSDNTYPFSQDSNFWYLTGISEPDITLVITNSEEYLIVPDRNASRQAFDGAVDYAELTAVSGVSAIYAETEGWERLGVHVRQSSSIATPAVPPQYIEQYGMYTNPARGRLAEKLKEIAPNLEPVDVRKELTDLRVVKQPVELAAIQEAIQVTADSLRALTAPEKFALYHDEYEIEADLGREFRMRGANGHAFAPIIAGGKRACTLHNVSNQAPLTPDSLVILDVGAEVEHYAADITRTKVYGEPAPRQTEVFEAVLDVQAYALGLLKPGVMLKEYEAAVEAYMGETLQKLGLIELGPDADANHDNIRKFYPHSTSHFLGLDVHDVGDYNQPLAADMVITCEPGIYIPDESIGVRIEDDVLITTDGCSVLSADLPKTLV